MKTQVEVTYTSLNRETNKITIGVFPVSGRYFRADMTAGYGNYYHTSVKLPEGKSFYQLFSNDDFNQPIENIPSIISENDPLKRVLINNTTDVFFPCSQLQNSPLQHYNFHQEVWNLKQ